jgi:glycosyltransferase involved in cell wall biosynthesis
MSLGTVAIVSDSAAFGGAELYLATLVSHLREEWRFVALVGDRADEETRRRLIGAGAELIEIPGLWRIARATGVVRAARALRKLDPSFVHVNLSDQGDGLGPFAAARASRKRTIATLHLVVPGRKDWREWISVRALRQPETVIAVSSFVASYARKAGADTVTVLNGLDMPDFVPEPRSVLGLAPDEVVIGGIGRLHDQKGWDVLCSAAAIVRREYPNAVFAVVGDGPERARLERMGAGSGVRFLGYRENASSLMRAFDVVVIPSRYEACGLVAIETMLAGVPVIATSVGGLPEVVGDCGVLVAPKRPDLLAAAIVELLHDPVARAAYAERAEARARSAFSAERMAADTNRVYLARSR